MTDLHYYTLKPNVQIRKLRGPVKNGLPLESYFNNRFQNFHLLINNDNINLDRRI